jgi:hypothetical protein
MKIPDFFPYSADCIKTKILSGPGAILNNADATINAMSESIGISI